MPQTPTASKIRLVLAIHNHQPVGNFPSVFEANYRDAYLPFLEVMEDYAHLPFVLHTSGPLMEWLVEQRPEYIERIKAMVRGGRLEILGGGFHEPILPMIPERDRIGQIRSYREYLSELFNHQVRGAWIAERVWEPSLVTTLCEADVEYTVLDDYHFQSAGLKPEDLHGYYLTEDQGRLLKVFPGSENLRYLIPFEEPHATFEHLRDLAARRPGRTVVFADDGEKFGAWPETFDHLYRRGWLRRFCDMLSANRDWIEVTTFARLIDTTLPVGKVYLPSASYREMTEWVLPTERLLAYQEAVRSADSTAQLDPQFRAAFDRMRPFVRGGGFWRNFRAKYPESDEMAARMQRVSDRLARLEGTEADPDYLDAARQELYRGQCNCPYWHGSFGGLYLPHLRNAIYRHLIAADVALDDAEGRSAPWVSLEIGDFNLDARQEVKLENESLAVWVRPALGGHVYEFDVKGAGLNLLATLDRRPEPYHAAFRASADQADSAPDHLTKKRSEHEMIEELLIYDHHPRKAFIDHFYPLNVTLEDLVLGRDVETGDAATGTYLARVRRGPEVVALIMERPCRVDECVVLMRKTLEMRAGSAALHVTIELEELPKDQTLRFALELNLAGMAGHADDRYYLSMLDERLGMLDSRLDLRETFGLSVIDEWLDVASRITWSVPGGVWCFPIATVSQSEAGLEGVHQSSAVTPHWLVRGDQDGRWVVELNWSVAPVRQQRASLLDEAPPAAQPSPSRETERARPTVLGSPR